MVRARSPAECFSTFTKHHHGRLFGPSVEGELSGESAVSSIMIGCWKVPSVCSSSSESCSDVDIASHFLHYPLYISIRMSTCNNYNQLIKS